MRICFFGTYDRGYVRNRNLRHGLRHQGIEVVECNIPLGWNTAEKIERVNGGWKEPAFLWRLARTYKQLLMQYRQVGPYDVMLVGYIGQLDMLLARYLSRLRRRPLVFDVLMSIRLIATERGLIARSPIKGRLIGWLERTACELADMIWLDTPQHVDYFHHLYGVPFDKFRLVPLGADESVFYPLPEPERPNRQLRVVYFGGYVPLHGVETIVGSARLLQDEGDIHFEMIGDGQTRPAAEALVQQWGLSNVTFTDWVPSEHLARHVAGAQVCLGVFGHHLQAQITVPNKIYEALALRKALITQNSPAAMGQFVARDHLLFCPAEDPPALAEAILTLKRDPALCQQLADEGHRLYQDRFTPRALGAQMAAHLQEVMDQ